MILMPVSSRQSDII